MKYILRILRNLTIQIKREFFSKIIQNLYIFSIFPYYLQHIGVKLLIRILVIIPLPRRPTSLSKFLVFDS